MMASGVRQAVDQSTNEITDYESDNTTIHEDYDIYVSEDDGEEEETQLFSILQPVTLGNSRRIVTDQTQQIMPNLRGPASEIRTVSRPTSVEVNHLSQTNIESTDQSESVGVAVEEEETQLYSSQPLLLDARRQRGEQSRTESGRPSIIVSNQSGVSNETGSQSGSSNATLQQLGGPSVETTQRPDGLNQEGNAHQAASGSQANDEHSESLLNDRPPRTRTPADQSILRPTSSQSLHRVSLQDVQSQPSLSPTSESHPSEPRVDNQTIQSAQGNEEEASEVLHAPNHRNRMVLDSLGDDQERQHSETIDLSQLLSNHSDTTVVLGNQVNTRPIRRRITEIVIDLDETDSNVSDLETDVEPMEVEEVTAAAQTTTGASSTSSAAARPGPSTAPADDSMVDFKVQKIIAAAAAAATAVAAAPSRSSDDEEAQTCIICYEHWTNSGGHRLASLKCGHLFGKSCIEKWLKSTAKCPQCNAKAKKADIRVIFAGKSLKTVDTTERDRALDDLRKEKEVRRKAEIDMAQANLRCRVALEEMNRLKAQLKSQEDRLRSSSSTSSSSSKALPSVGQGKDGTRAPLGQYVLDKTIQISQSGNCRVMSFDSFNNALVVSMPSPNQLFPGFGVKKVSATDLRCTQYVPIHTSVIRALTFNGRNDGLMLTASTDKTLRMTSLVSNTVVQMYKTDAPVWSCAWNTADVNYVYAGLQNGTIMVYDTRQVNNEVHKLSLENSRCPIVSLNYVPKAADEALGCSGLLMASLGGMSFWEQTADTDFKPHLLQADGLCTSLSFNNRSRHCLASFRPNKNHSRTRHVMCELKHERDVALSTSEVACHQVQTFYGGTTMKVLSRSVLYQSPGRPDQLFACSGDEATTSALIWDTTTGIQVQKLLVNSTVLDICPFQYNRHNLLAALTDKQVKLYSWQPTK